MKNPEAESLLSQGKNALNSGEFKKAIDLLQKSQSLEPSENTQKLLEKAKNSLKQVSPPTYSSEDETFSKSILSKTNYYEVLGLEKTATLEQIKKSHKRLVLKLHPDKNQAPSAGEAFIRVQKAYECLSDDSGRKHYDEFGEEMEGNIDFSHLFTKEGAAAVIAGFALSSIYSPGHFLHKWFRGSEATGTGASAKYFGIGFLVILIVFSSLLQEFHEYSLHKSPFFDLKVTSENFKLFSFYVNQEAFALLSKESQASLMKKAETSYHQKLESECEGSRRVKKEILSQMKNTDSMNSKLYQVYANSISHPSCSLLSEIFSIS
jgi:curved DNA-binding protein CbpA